MGTLLKWNGTDATGTPLRWNTPGLKWNGSLPERTPMGNGKIDFNLTAQQVQDIKDGFAAVEALLAWTANMTDEQRKKFYKAGKKLAVIQDARNAVVDNPTAFPASFDTAPFLRDADGFNVATELTSIAARVHRKLEDTMILVGSDCMDGVSVVRDHINAAARTTPGLQATATRLASYFKHDGSSSPPPPPNP